MAAEGIGARKPSPTSPEPIGFEIPATDKFLLARVKSFVAFPIMLTSERLGTYRTHERAFVCVRAKVGPQIVGASEALGTKVALEGGRMFLNPFIIRVRARSSRHRQSEKIISIGWNGVC